MTYEDFTKKCDAKICLRKRKFHPKGCYLDSKRRDCYEKFSKTKGRSIDEEEIELKNAVWERDAGVPPSSSNDWKSFCRFYNSLSENEKLRFLNLNKENLWLCKNLDVAHIKGKGANPELKYDVENCVLLNRFVHSRLDNYKDPFTGESIDASMREFYFDKIRSVKNDGTRI